MGGGGSRHAGLALDLPQQEVVSRHVGHMPIAPLGRNGLVPRPVVPPCAYHETTEQMKVPLVWDKSSFHVERAGASKHVWVLTAEFSAEVPCALGVHFHCREEAGDHVLEYSRADKAAPPSLTQNYDAGKHTVRLEGDGAIDLKRWPLEVFWKYKQKQADVLPIVFSLNSDGFQTILQFTLEVPPAHRDGARAQAAQRRGEGPELKCTLLKQKVFVGGREYTVKEVYGLADLGKDDAHDETAVGEPCVICLSEPRNTAVLPCRHLCICEDCARQLQVGASTRNDHCPICRGSIAGVQVFDVRK